MIKNAVLAMVLAGGVCCAAGQSTTQSATYAPETQLADGNPVGLLGQFNINGLDGTVDGVQVNLDISGGYNGDLYVYLQAPSGQTAVLLNRPGVTAANPYGSSDSGVKILLDWSSAANVHYYGSSGYSINGLGQVTGTYAADGRTIGPQSSGEAFDAASSTAGLNIFSGLSGTALNGTWWVFAADCALGGGAPTFHSLEIQITTVPEPGALTLLLAAGLALRLSRRAR